MSEFSENTVESVVIEGLKKMELSQAVQEDHKMITAALPEAAIVSLTSQFLTMVLMRTAYSRVQLRIQIPEKYPDEVRIYNFHPFSRHQSHSHCSPPCPCYHIMIFERFPS